jgi:translation initiation factor 1 (eIF-1/SUI1)
MFNPFPIGVSAKDASKLFRNKFAAGATVQKDGSIDIQGDFKREVVEILLGTEEWGVR